MKKRALFFKVLVILFFVANFFVIFIGVQEAIANEINLSLDSDKDGISDYQDNCPNIPNGPEIGTCLPESDKVGIVCNSDVDCVIGCSNNGRCSLNQEDSDNNGIGDVCDSPITTSTTIITTTSTSTIFSNGNIIKVGVGTNVCDGAECNYATLSEALIRANDNDTITVYTDTIESSFPRVRKNNLTIQAASGITPTVNVTGVSYGLFASVSESGVVNYFLSISGLKFVGNNIYTTNIFYFVGADNSTATINLTNVEVAGSVSDAISTSSSNLSSSLVLNANGCVVHDCGNANRTADGFKINGGNNTVLNLTNCRAYNFTGGNAGASDGISLHYGSATLNNFTVYNCNNGISNTSYDGSPTMMIVNGATIYNCSSGAKLVELGNATSVLTLNKVKFYSNTTNVGSLATNGTVNINYSWLDFSSATGMQKNIRLANSSTVNIHASVITGGSSSTYVFYQPNGFTTVVNLTNSTIVKCGNVFIANALSAPTVNVKNTIFYQNSLDYNSSINLAGRVSEFYCLHNGNVISNNAPTAAYIKVCDGYLDSNPEFMDSGNDAEIG